MAGASIRVVSNRTGIPADTLRMWERRYGFPKPGRTEGGARVYSEEDVERLLLVNRALAEGYRPNEVVPLPRVELEKVTSSSGVARATVATRAAAAPITVDAFIDALGRDDVDAVRGLLRAGALTMGPKAFVTDLAHPLSVRVGELWEAGKLEVRHEHLATACLTTTLRTLLAAHEDEARSRSPVVVLATLPGERHALALDMVAVYLAASLAAPRLLGADTPVDQIAAAAASFGADVVGISVSAAAESRETSRAAQRLAALLSRRVALWIGGAGARRIATPNEKVRKIATWTELDDAIREADGTKRRSE